MTRTSNLGATRLRRRKRAEDPMRTFDALPVPLRRWLAEAAMPWSPASCRSLWKRARKEGAPVEEILARLDRAEASCLGRTTDPNSPRNDVKVPTDRKSPG